MPVVSPGTRCSPAARSAAPRAASWLGNVSEDRTAGVARKARPTRQPARRPGRDHAGSGSPTEIRPREWRAPIRQATLVTDFGLRTTASELDTSLRLAAHEHHKFRALAGLRAQCLV